MNMFKRNLFLEDHSEYFESIFPCEVYSKGDDQGFVIRVYQEDGKCELYEFDNGSYMFLGTYTDFGSAVYASEHDFN